LDDAQFDRLARSLSMGRSRRNAAGLVGALAALPLLAPVTGEAKKKKGKKKKKKGKKKKGKNKNKNKKPTTTQAPVTTTPRPCSVRPTDNLQAAINDAPAGSTLALCAGTWNLASQMTVGKNLTITGAGSGQTVLDGGGMKGVLMVQAGATVLLQDLAIKNGNTEGSFGGGIYTIGNLTLRGVEVTACKSDSGGGIFVFSGGALLLEAGTQVAGNSARQTTNPNGGYGGGICNSGGTVKLAAGSSVTANTATHGGGGIYSPSAITLDPGSTVSGNTGVGGQPDNCQPDIVGVCI
jgi:predicted outer membrane repeat protein